MEELVEELVLKRLCCKKDTSLKNLKERMDKANICKCNLSFHIACVFIKKNDNIIKLSIGINDYKKINGVQCTIHAEKSSFEKLKKNDTNNYKKINIIVLKTSQTGVLSNSKPCIKCIYEMYNLPIYKGFCIKNIYYSDYSGCIVKKNINELLDDKNKHLSRFYKNKK